MYAKLNEYILIASHGNLYQWTKVHNLDYQSLRAKLHGTRKMDITTLKKLAEILGVEVSELLFNLELSQH